MNKTILIALFILLLSGLSKTSGQNLIITGVMDGDLSGGLPKAIEICVLNDIADLSEYSIAMVYNANTSPATQFTFPAVAASAGDFITVAQGDAVFNNYMGSEADYYTNNISGNGDDRYLIMKGEMVLDIFGEFAVDGTGTDWEYIDGFAYRKSGTSPDGASFNIDNWDIYNRGLEGFSTNAEATVPFPSKSFKSGSGAQSTGISGTINSYSKVTAVGVDWVELADNATGFAANDKVLIIQMKGAELFVGGSVFGSTITNSIGDFGYYEFVIIDAVSTSPDRITFKNDLRGNYDPESFVQLIKVKEYENVTVDGLLTCDPWDETSGTGGVLTFLVDNNLFLNADIDVSGKGFEGGISDIIQGLTITAQNVDPDLLDFTEAENKAARKGRGIASHIGAVPINYDNYARGKGRFANGGGGGNGRYAGGGGGSSYGSGGVSSAGADLDGFFGRGIGGQDISMETWVTHFYYPVVMGGGGGAGGKGSVSDVASDGGRGGGIIIILADTIFGNGYSIKADGESVWPVAENNGGAGGGGAGGAIVISSNFSSGSALTISANGGDGGHTYNFYGSGGGGSGGLIFTSNDLLASGVVSSVESGYEGSAPYLGMPSGVTSGGSGKVTDTLLIRLNGFLYNTIVSDVTKSRVDSICYGESAPKIVGTTPVGGLAPYTFEWQKGADDGSWGGLLPDNGKDLDLLVPETDTIYLRRIVKDSSPTQIIDTSKAVMIIVQPPITGNIVGYDTTIYWNQDPDALLPLDILGGGNLDSSKPDSTFSWLSSPIINPDYHLWSQASGTSDLRTYDPPILTDTMYYFRVVKSGACYDTSNIVTIVVRPLSEGNALLDDLMVSGVTIDGFRTDSLTYKYVLSNGTVVIPEVTAIATDPDAVHTITDASSLTGTEAERTTTISVTSCNGLCSLTYKVVFEVSTGIENSMDSELKIYPVPVSTELIIKNIRSAKYIEVVDITGSKVYERAISGEESHRINISQLPEGIYFLRLSDGTNQITRKFIKQ